MLKKSSKFQLTNFSRDNLSHGDFFKQGFNLLAFKVLKMCHHFLDHKLIEMFNNIIDIASLLVLKKKNTNYEFLIDVFMYTFFFFFTSIIMYEFVSRSRPRTFHTQLQPDYN